MAEEQLHPFKAEDFIRNLGRQKSRKGISEMEGTAARVAASDGEN